SRVFPPPGSWALVVVLQLDVPVSRVGQAQERKPLAVGDPPFGRAEHRRPAWPTGGPQHLHPGLDRRACSPLEVTWHAAAHDVLPGGAPALRTRHHMIQVELRPREVAPAVLASVVVARVDVESRKPYLGTRDAIVKLQNDDTRDADSPGGRMDHIVA